MIDRFGTRSTMIFGMVFQCASVALFILVQNYWALLAARLCQGLASSICWAAGMVLLGDVFPQDKQGMVIGSTVTAGGKKKEKERKKERK
jgi:MFS family permease